MEENMWFRNNRRKDVMLKNDSLTLITPLKIKIARIEKCESVPEGSQEISLGSMNHILSAIPNGLSSMALANAYKVVFPHGSIGTLMQYKDGLLGTPLVESTSGKIIGNAGLAPLNTGAVVLGAFTLLSFVTGQYFLSKIKKELKQMNDVLVELRQTIIDIKESELFASVDFLNYVEQNFYEIVNHKEHLVATLTNVQAESIKLHASSLFYERQIGRIMGEMSSEQTSTENFEELVDMIEKWRYSCYGFFCVRLLEVRLSGNFDAGYLEKIKDDLSERKEFFKNYMISTTKKIEENISIRETEKNVWEKIRKRISEKYLTKGEKEAAALRGQLPDYNTIVNDEYEKFSNVTKSIDLLQAINNGATIYYYENKTYISVGCI